MMPRHFTEEIDDAWGWGRRLPGRFNDASAFHRGNLPACSVWSDLPGKASMMPRHFTEEINGWKDIEAAGYGASMMPRHFTEEIIDLAIAPFAPPMLQ